MAKTPRIEAVKTFWDSRPCNVRHSAKEVGTKEYFDEVETKKHFVEPHILSFADFSNWRGKRVLEIGCGIGTAAVNFARAGAHYTGIDLSGESIRIARKRFEVYGYKGEFYEGNAEQLESFLPKQKFDLIYSFGVIHHTPDPKKVIEKMSAYLDIKGTLKIMIYAKNSWKSFMIEEGYDQPEAQAGCPIVYTYTEEEARQLLLPYFFVTDIRQDHIFPYQVEPYNNGEYVKQPWFEHMPDAVFNVLQKRLGWHLLITAKHTGA